MKTVLIDKELHRKVKSFAAERGMKLGEVIEAALRRWIKKQEEGRK
jgi:hypothetical protein